MAVDARSALTAPIRGPARERPLVAAWIALLLAPFVLLLSLVPLLGYLSSFLVASAADDPVPGLTDGKGILRRGFLATIVTAVLIGAPSALLAWTVAGAAGGAATPSGFGALVLAAGWTLVLSIAFLGAYLWPVALFVVGRSAGLASLLDLAFLSSHVRTTPYLVGWTIGALVVLVTGSVTATLAIWNPLGAVVGALLLAYGLLLAGSLWGRAIGRTSGYEAELDG